MAEPSRSNPVKPLSNFVGTPPPFVRHRETLFRLKNMLQEMRFGILRCALQVGYGRSYGELIALYLLFVHILQAMLHRASGESEPTLSMNLQHGVEVNSWERLASRRDQDVRPSRACYNEAIKVFRLIGNIQNSIFTRLAIRPFLTAARKFNAPEGTLP